MEFKNPFALYGERIITIHDLDISQKGLKCNCICPVCHAKFEAKMGDIRQWHFAHSGTPCDKTALYVNSCYRFVRQILLEKGTITYPGLRYKGELFFSEGTISVEDVEIRYNSQNIANGLIINNNQIALRIKLKKEYCVEEVSKKLDDLSTLSLDLSLIDDMDTETIALLICTETSGKSWIYSKAAERHVHQSHKSFYNTDVSTQLDSASSAKPVKNAYTKLVQKTYTQPMVRCKLCKNTVHQEDAMWGRNTHGYVCHKCIESKGLDWKVL